MKLSDFKGIFKKSKLTLQDKGNLGLDYWYFDFKVDQDYSWEAGEHGAFIMKNPKIKGKSFRAFSVASIPEEGFLRIITRSGKEPSNFKQALIDFQENNKLTIIGPFGWFKLPPKPSPIVIIVGGVGFAPARALLKKLEFNQHYSVKLLYISDDIFLYQAEMDKIAENNQNISITYYNDRKIFMDDIQAIYHNLSNKAYYYISGSVPLIKSMKQNLKKFGIKRGRIVSDPFYGY